jgi:hypothetical protein
MVREEFLQISAVLRYHAYTNEADKHVVAAEQSKTLFFSHVVRGIITGACASYRSTVTTQASREGIRS